MGGSVIPVLTQTKLPRNGLFGKVSFTNEKRRHKNAVHPHFAHYGLDLRLNLPKRFSHLAEQPPLAQCCGMLVRRRARITVPGGTVPY
jgi:hypothetical protein